MGDALNKNLANGEFRTGGGRLTGVFFAFVALIISVWAIVIKPVDDNQRLNESRLNALEIKVSENHSSLSSLEISYENTANKDSELLYEINEINDEIDACIFLINNNSIVDADLHARLEERIKVLEKALEKMYTKLEGK